MDFLNTIWQAEGVQQAAGAVVSAALLFVVAYLRELAARVAAQSAAMHAESVARETGARGADKMDMAVAHMQGSLPLGIRPGKARTMRLIEGVLPEARASLVPPPPNGSNGV